MTTGERAFELIRNAKMTSGGEIELPLIIIPDQVVYPHVFTPLTLTSTPDMAAARYAIEHNQTIITALRQQNPASSDLLDTMHTVATETALGYVSSGEEADELLVVLAQGRRRVAIQSVTQSEPFVMVKARVLKERPADATRAANQIHAVLDLFENTVELNESIPDEVADYVMSVENTSQLSDLIAATLNIPPAGRQALLEELDVEERLKHLARLLAEEISTLEVHNEVSSQVQQEMARSQREMFLREQMRVIQTELGEEDIYQQEINELQQMIDAAQLPADIRDKAMKELSRLAAMAPMAPETAVIRTYLDWLTSVPWHATSRDRLNLAHAEKVLNSAHYGLKKVKERILEHIAVRKLARDKMQSPIICFVGPPGVGKTSLGKSIADALGREFVRISLGGVRDEAEIRGHRRTYIGAMPGRIIQTMKRVGTVNPVFMLDEIDKLSADYRGDPAAALLEVLDPEQNKEFVDHYLEVPYDLSQVMFITTANDLYPLPEALEDRMEIIEFRSYTEEEKLEIAKRFLVPKTLEAHGLKRRRIRFQEDALLLIIRQYTMEAGVRNLEREIANVCRKIARLVATKKRYPHRITPLLVEKFLGPPYVLQMHVNREDTVGLVTGLVWTPNGGDIQIIEASLLTGKGSLMLTGQLGDVLQESAQAALSFMRARARSMNIPVDDFENYDIHIHMPEGAVPKDGPSAGITLATAIVSAYTERKIRSNYAMTGEVTLRGQVLPVGGIKEKVLAARRYRIPNIILPKDNEKDLKDVPAQALRDLTITFVDHMDQVLDLVLMDVPEQRQRDIDALQDEADENGEDNTAELDVEEHIQQAPATKRKKKDGADNSE